MGLFGFGKKKEEIKEDRTKKENKKENEKEIVDVSMSELLTGMAEKLGYPYQILSANLTPSQLMEVYKEALKRGEKEGFTPVLVPEDDILEEYFEILRDEEEYSVGSVLKNIGDNGKEILEKRLKELMEPEELDEEFIGELVGGKADDEFVSLFELGGEDMMPTLLVEVPTKNPWEVVAYVPFGGWNECPDPEEMATICKYWHEKYTAIPAAITHDTLEFFLPDPVKKTEVMELAKEHYAFCNDRVDQCTDTGTFGEVADSLWQSHVWYFWWD